MLPAVVALGTRLAFECARSLALHWRKRRLWATLLKVSTAPVHRRVFLKCKKQALHDNNGAKTPV